MMSGRHGQDYAESGRDQPEVGYAQRGEQRFWSATSGASDVPDGQSARAVTPVRERFSIAGPIARCWG